EALRLPQDFSTAAGVKKLITRVQVRKPSKEWFIRTHPDPAYRLATTILELKDSQEDQAGKAKLQQRQQEIYLVAPSLRSTLQSEVTVSSTLLVLSINRQGTNSFGRSDSPALTGLSIAGTNRRWMRPKGPSHNGSESRPTGAKGPTT